MMHMLKIDEQHLTDQADEITMVITGKSPTTRDLYTLFTMRGSLRKSFD
jgi:hypothetical protein